MFNPVHIPTSFWKVGGESVQNRTDARYGFFYNAALTVKAGRSRPQRRVNDE